MSIGRGKVTEQMKVLPSRGGEERTTLYECWGEDHYERVDDWVTKSFPKKKKDTVTNPSSYVRGKRVRGLLQ